MLRIIETFNHLPVKVNFDKNCEIIPGQIVSLKIKDSKETLDICDGLHPYGIVDDFHSKKYRNVVFGELVSIKDFVDNKYQLKSNIIKNSFNYTFSSGLLELKVNFKSGEITLPNNHHDNGTFCFHYAYNTTNNDNFSTIVQSASVWKNNMILETDMFDVTQYYGKYFNLYVENGLLTTKKSNELCKSVGIILNVPTFENPVLRYLFDLKGVIDVKTG